MKKTVLIVGLLLGVLLLMTACSNPGTSGSGKSNTSQVEEKKDASSGLIDPRNLLTRAEAEALMGEALKEAEYNDTKNALGQKIVMYSPTSDKAVRFLQLSLVQNEAMSANLRGSGYNVSKLYQETKKNLPGAQAISGIGDEAFWGTNGLHILKGNVYLNISVGNSSKAENLELAKQAAAKALARL